MMRVAAVLTMLGLALPLPALAASAADTARNFGRMAAPGLPGYRYRPTEARPHGAAAPAASTESRPARRLPRRGRFRR